MSSADFVAPPVAERYAAHLCVSSSPSMRSDPDREPPFILRQASRYRHPTAYSLPANLGYRRWLLSIGRQPKIVPMGLDLTRDLQRQARQSCGQGIGSRHLDQTSTQGGFDASAITDKMLWSVDCRAMLPGDLIFAGAPTLISATTGIGSRFRQTVTAGTPTWHQRIAMAIDVQAVPCRQIDARNHRTCSLHQ